MADTDVGVSDTYTETTAGESSSSGDTYTEITTQGWGSRILNSLAGVLIGILLFFGSIVLLFWNEGRYDLSTLARTATETSAAAPDAKLNGHLVAATGAITASDPLGDGQYLRPGPYAAIRRVTEMYAWVESSSSDTKKNVGGSQTTQTTYSYERKWQENPPVSSHFKVQQGHENPSKPLASTQAAVPRAKIGALDIAQPGALTLPALPKLPLNDQVVDTSKGAVLAGDYVYVGKGTAAAPAIGDVRISYFALPAGTQVTVFGKLAGSTLDPYVDGGSHRLYRVFAGTKAEAVASLHGEFTALSWILRVAGFVLMWIGLWLLFGPLTTVLDFLPFLGNITGALIGFVTFVVALALSLFVIVLSAILHNVWALLVIVAAIVAFLVLRRRSKPAVRAPGYNAP